MELIYKHTKISDSGCWEWVGCKLPSGYGKLTKNKKTWLAHRYAFTEMCGKIPDGMVVMHKCDNPSCCNPEHLSIGTHKDNQHDSISKGRSYTGKKPWVAKGEDAYNAKLSFDKAKYIRHLYFAERNTLSELARYFDVSFQTVSKVVNNIRWVAA